MRNLRGFWKTIEDAKYERGESTALSKEEQPTQMAPPVQSDRLQRIFLCRHGMGLLRDQAVLPVRPIIT